MPQDKSEVTVVLPMPVETLAAEYVKQLETIDETVAFFKAAIKHLAPSDIRIIRKALHSAE